MSTDMTTLETNDAERMTFDEQLEVLVDSGCVHPRCLDIQLGCGNTADHKAHYWGSEFSWFCKGVRSK